MSVNRGYVQSFAQQTLGSGAGRVFALSQGGLLIAVRVQFNTTATVGNRQLCMRIADAQNRPLIGGFDIGNLAAGGLFECTYGAGMPAFGAAQFQGIGIPMDCVIPSGCQMTIFDNTNTDVNDTIQPNVLMAI